EDDGRKGGGAGRGRRGRHRLRNGGAQVCRVVVPAHDRADVDDAVVVGIDADHRQVVDVPQRVDSLLEVAARVGGRLALVVGPDATGGSVEAGPEQRRRQPFVYAGAAARG